MKTLQIKTIRMITMTMLFSILFTAVSCGSSSGKEENSDTKPVKVKPPQIDIHTAVITDNIEAVKQHIAAGTNINEKDPFGGSSPLISASLFGKPEIARVLMDAGADLNFQNNDGSTPLHVAAFFCRPEIVQMLLDKGADKSIQNNYKATPYQSVAGPFAESKPAYDMMSKMLAPMGLILDYDYIEKTRPVIADKLK